MNTAISPVLTPLGCDNEIFPVSKSTRQPFFGSAPIYLNISESYCLRARNSLIPLNPLSFPIESVTSTVSPTFTFLFAVVRLNTADGSSSTAFTILPKLVNNIAINNKIAILAFFISLFLSLYIYIFVIIQAIFL